MIDPGVIGVIGIPAVAVPVMALMPTGYRYGAVINVLVSGLTLLAGLSLLWSQPFTTDTFIIDGLNIPFIVLSTFIGFTTSVFSVGYISHELETGRLTTPLLRFYHTMFQITMGAMNLALVSNNIGLLWVGLEVATLMTVILVGIYRTPEAVEAAWKYFILSSVGILLAFFGTILIYIAAQAVLGAGMQSMAWSRLEAGAARFNPALLNLAFIFFLIGYGTKIGLVPLYAWLPDAYAKGPTPVSALLSGLLENVAMYALLRFKMLLAANPHTISEGRIMIVMGLASLLFAAFMLYRQRDIKRFFAYSSIEHMGIITFAFGIGGPLANFAGLLHMTMHSLTKSAIFFSTGHIAQAKGTQRFADIRGLSVSHPLLAWGLALGTIAIAGLPPFGVFMSEFLIVTSTVARAPLLAVLLVAGLVISFGAILLRLQGVLFEEPDGPSHPVKTWPVPLFVHLALVLVAGLYLPLPLVHWFRQAASLLT